MMPKDRLRSLIEEYRFAFQEVRTSNEGLASVNGELTSRNRALESCRRELLSRNQELSALNSELLAKVRDLEHVKKNFESFFRSNQNAALFLDGDLKIRSLTPGITETLGLLPGDRGKPLSHVRCLQCYDALEADLRAVLTTGETRARHVAHSDGKTHFMIRAVPTRAADMSTDGVVVTFVDVTGVLNLETQKDVLIAELNHRIKNMLAIIIAIARQTARRSPSAESFYDTFTARLHAMSRTYELLSRESWVEVGLEKLIKEELCPYSLDIDDRISISGPPVPLKPKAALSLGLIFHELATNAAKYGALSSVGGRVTLTWAREARHPAKIYIRFEWRERGGPRVVTPEKFGFGLSLVKNEARYSLGGKSNIRFEPAGLIVDLEMPFPRQGP